MTDLVARARRRLASRTPPASVGAVLRFQRPAAIRAATLVRASLLFPPYWVLTHLDDARYLLDPKGADFLWPVAWVGWGDPSALAPVALALGLTGVLAGALLPGPRATRALAFLGLLELLALRFSFGKVHHLMHAWLFATFFWVWLPAGWTRPERLDRVGRHAILLVFGALQVLVAATYSLAGFAKVGGTVYQALLGQPTPLHPDALARHLADRILQTRPESLLGPFMIDHAPWLWPMMLGTVYLQLFAVVAAFRPRLHAAWGAGLVLFHATTALSLTIDFNPAIVIVGLLFVASPFQPRTTPRAWLADLPLVGAAVRRRLGAARPRTAPDPGSVS